MRSILLDFLQTIHTVVAWDLHYSHEIAVYAVVVVELGISPLHFYCYQRMMKNDLR